MKQKAISETVDVGPSNSGKGPNVFFVGTHSKTIDINSDWSVPQFKETYKKLDALSVQNGFFVTSLPQYAIQYADNFAIEKKAKPIILAMEFKKDVKFFDLESKQDYLDAGINSDIADIFISAEPYFAINNQLDANKMPYQPYEFSVVKNLLGGGGSWDEIISKKNFKDRLEKINNPSKFEQAYVEWYSKGIIQPFEYLLGKDNPLISSVYTTQTFTDRADFISRLSADADAAAADDKKLIGRNRTHIKAKKKDVDGNIKADDDIQSRSTINGAWNRGTQMEDGLPSYMHARKLSDYPASMVETPLFNNYKLLFGQNKEAGRNRSFKQLDISTDWHLYNAYIQLFREMHDFMNTDAALQDEGYIRLGLKAVKDRIASKRTNDPAGKHIYIDIMQFICFSMILEKCREKQLDIYGVATREKIGYNQIRDNGDGYGYTAKELAGGFLQGDDRTLIICRPIPLKNIRIIGHDVTKLKRYDKRGLIYRRYVKGVKTADEYMSQVLKLYSDINKRIKAKEARREEKRKAEEARREEERRAEEARREEERKAEEAARQQAYRDGPDKEKDIRIFGTAYKIIDGKWNRAYSYNNVSSHIFSGYTGLGEWRQVADWLMSVFKTAGYFLQFEECSIYYNDLYVQKRKCPVFDCYSINGKHWDIIYDFDDTRYKITPEDFQKQIQSAIDQINGKVRKDITTVKQQSSKAITASPDQYKTYSANLQILSRDNAKEIEFRFMLKNEFCSNLKNPKATNQYIEKTVLRNIMKKIPVYPFLIAVQAIGGVESLPEDLSKIDIINLTPDGCLNPEVNCGIEVNEIFVDNNQKQDAINKIGGGAFIPLSPYTLDNISEEIKTIIYPEALIEWAKRYLEKTGKNYNLDRPKTWETLAKEVLGYIFTQADYKLINEEEYLMPRFSQYMATFLL